MPTGQHLTDGPIMQSHTIYLSGNMSLRLHMRCKWRHSSSPFCMQNHPTHANGQTHFHAQDVENVEPSPDLGLYVNPVTSTTCTPVHTQPQHVAECVAEAGPPCWMCLLQSAIAYAIQHGLLQPAHKKDARWRGESESGLVCE